MGSVILGAGKALGKHIVTNEDIIEKIRAAGGEETTLEWIEKRTGIKTRYHVGHGEPTSAIAIEAATDALDNAGISIDEIDAIIVATMTPDYGGTPTTAAMVQKALAAKPIPAFDINAACSGFIYALMVAHSLLQTFYKKILVIGADALSNLIDWGDRSVAPLLGDGAGALILSREPTAGLDTGICDIICFCKGDNEKLIVPAGGTRWPARVRSVIGKMHFLKMQGKEVFRFAVEAGIKTINELLERNFLRPEHIQHIFLHQANVRIIEAIAEKTKIPLEKFFSTIRDFGNTSAASIPLGLAAAQEKGVLNKGDKIFLVAFGGGLTWGGCYASWEL